MTDLNEIARAMVAPGKGVLAIDETAPTATKRFEKLGIESTPESRRDYRMMLCLTPGIGEYVSGAILYDETLRQETPDGRPVPEALKAAGIIPGIKVDTGAKPLAASPEETITEGLDGLRGRLEEYYAMGARFAKWRAVIKLGPHMPSRLCIETNAHALGRYAALAQEAGIVPIVEPEILMDGDHDIDRCQQATESVLRAVFRELVSQYVQLEGMVLKPNMTVPGLDCGKQASPDEVADRTLATLRRCVPAAVPGIAFLSGGMSGEDACRNLNAINQRPNLPWEVSYSFGRALQFPAMELWDGKESNVQAAQAAFSHRARMTSLARQGKYSPELEKEAA
jgi:fructose-bisphosphate aldolase class I